MFNHEEILAYQKRIIALEEQCEIYAESAPQFCKLCEEVLNTSNDSIVKVRGYRERLDKLHATKRGPTSAEALLEFARTKQFKTEPEEELGVTFNVVMIEWLEEWVLDEKTEF